MRFQEQCSLPFSVAQHLREAVGVVQPRSQFRLMSSAHTWGNLSGNGKQSIAFFHLPVPSGLLANPGTCQTKSVLALLYRRNAKVGRAVLRR